MWRARVTGAVSEGLSHSGNKSNCCRFTTGTAEASHRQRCAVHLGTCCWGPEGPTSGGDVDRHRQKDSGACAGPELESRAALEVMMRAPLSSIAA